MPDIEVKGICYGVEETGAGSPLLLLHGFTGSAQSWKHLIPELSKSCRVITIDLPGHGRTSAPTDPKRCAFTRIINDLAFIARELGIESAAWIGYSMGGRTALAVAIEHPWLVSVLILESASPGLDDQLARAERRHHDELLAQAIERDGIPQFIADWEKLPLWASQAPLADEMKTRQRAIRMSNSARGLAGSLRGMGTGSQPSYWDRLPSLERPVLLLAGQEDTKFAQIATEMHAALPNARLEIVPDAGHAIHLERPQRYLQLVSEFLDDTRRTNSHELKEEVA